MIRGRRVVGPHNQTSGGMEHHLQWRQCRGWKAGEYDVTIIQPRQDKRRHQSGSNITAKLPIILIILTITIIGLI